MPMAYRMTCPAVTWTYEQAFSADLDGDDLRRGLIQYGSTLRSLGRFDEAVPALRRADEQFPRLEPCQWALRQYAAELSG